MTVITHKRRKSRLTEMIDKPGGISIGVALSQAEANIEERRGSSVEAVAEMVKSLLAIEQPTSLEDNFERLIEVYRGSNAIIDVASPFGLNELCEAASHLCNLVDAAPAGELFDWRIVTVHAQAMQMLLRLPEDAAEARATVLAGLQQVKERNSPTPKD
ncbi:chemotaxis protein CheE [uncultured Brevundimonas sp.]|uniref:chemotaxis protein CheE n=1 Tax=uncultured Brevundimonas sp. TaxID=213418 RepID=UPI0030EC7A00|tara:strand:- start:226 stop:702 length:477 start_codon:yes stop_codon:yes gene_type:complete